MSAGLNAEVTQQTESYSRQLKYTVVHKNVALYFCPRLRQLMTDFQNSFTGTLCGKFAIT